jgi:hypothetical protein
MNKPKKDEAASRTTKAMTGKIPKRIEKKYGATEAWDSLQLVRYAQGKPPYSPAQLKQAHRRKDRQIVRKIAQWSKNRRETCDECGKRAWGGRLGSWLVSDKLWKAAGYRPSDVACRACLRKRLAKFRNP